MSTADRAREDAEPVRRRGWFVFRPIDLGDLAVQTFAVILGVLIALGVDDLGKRHETAAKIESARAALRSEMGMNQRRLTERIAQWEVYRKAAEADPERRTTAQNDCSSIEGWPGLGLPILLSSAYATSSGAGVFADMDFAESQRIAQIYAVQARLVEQTATELNLYILRFDTKDGATPCKYVFSDRTSAAKQVVSEYTAYLDGKPAP